MSDIAGFSYGFSWWSKTPDTWGTVEDAAIERVEKLGVFSLQFKVPEDNVSIPLTLNDPYKITGISLQLDGEDLRGNFYQRFSEGPPQGGHALNDPPFRIGRLEPALDDTTGPPDFDLTWVGANLPAFGKPLAQCIREDRELTQFQPLFEIPPLAMSVAACLLAWLGVEDFRQIANDAIHNETEPRKTRLREAIFAEVSSLQQDLKITKLGEAWANDEGILGWDAKLADTLAKWGATKEAQKVRKERTGKGNTELWNLWLPQKTGDTCRALTILAKALWKYKVKPAIEQEEAKPPALVTLVHDEYLHLVTRNFKREGEGGQQAIVFPEESILRVTTIGEDTLNALMIQKGIDLFGSVASHKVFRWQIFTGHKQALENNPDPRVLRIDGGWDYFADLLGLNNKQAKQLEQIIEAQHATSLMLPGHDKPTRLLIREYFKQRGRSRAQIKLILGTALLPDYVEELKKLAKGRVELQRWKRLIPVCDMPPTIGRPNEAGAQSTLSMLTVGDFRDHAVELVEEGGTDLLSRIEALAVKAGVPVRTIPALIDRWENDGPDGPAFLKRSGKRLFTLGDAHKAQREFIEDGGRRELEGAKAGKKGAAKRRETLRRKGN